MKFIMFPYGKFYDECRFLPLFVIFVYITTSFLKSNHIYQFESRVMLHYNYNSNRLQL
jgi:hypothetical protein